MTATQSTEAIQNGTGSPVAPPVPEALPRVASRQGRLAWGKALRKVVARSAQGGWEPPSDRPDPVEELLEADLGRPSQFLPLRYGRMIASPFAFYRNAVALMARDLASTPATGVRVQVSGNAHVGNFGAFATPDRNVTFDLHAFDETLQAPWEWDVKRLATSALIVGRQNRLGRKASREAAAAAVRAYREQMLTLAGQRELEIWYDRMDAGRLLDKSRDQRKRRRRTLLKAAQSSIADEHPRLGIDDDDDDPRIRERPPIMVHARDDAGQAMEEQARRVLVRYRAALAEEKQVLYDRFELHDVALNLAGTGSGGASAVVLLLAGENDSVFLQVKEARRSVLEPFAGPSEFMHQGQRVVVGQRLLQAVADPFLGWTDGDSGRHFYVRQVRNAKRKAAIESCDAEALAEFAGWCGWTLARAHARSGDAAVIAGYLGQGEPFDRAITEFAQAYAEQNDRDYQALVSAVTAGRVEAVRETAS